MDPHSEVFDRRKSRSFGRQYASKRAVLSLLHFLGRYAETPDMRIAIRCPCASEDRKCALNKRLAKSTVVLQGAGEFGQKIPMGYRILQLVVPCNHDLKIVRAAVGFVAWLF